MKTTLFALALAAFGMNAAQAAVDYQLRITDAAQHLAEVKTTFPATKGHSLDVQMPVWRTGRYQIGAFANGVRQFKAVNGKGEALAFTKTDKSTWRVEMKPGDAVTVSYELYANELGGRTRHIDDTHAYLDASGVFMYAAPFRNEALTVKLEVPQGWVSRSGMDAGSCGHCFKAPSYDVLIDSPIETGIHEFASFAVDGRQFDVAIWGKGNHEMKKIVADYTKIVTETGRMFGNKWPFQRYLFIIHATDGASGATEHINSTVIQTRRWNFGARKSYLTFLTTSAHEFFHTWNVKAYRPKEMVPYDYSKENYNRLLWIAEGNTSYYASLIVQRAGISKQDEFLERFASAIERYTHEPGRFQQSASEGSFDEWISTAGERRRNASIDIYGKGEMLALALDLEVRRMTKGAKGFEDVHRILYAKHSVSQGGYDAKAVLAGLKDVTGQDWSAWWAQYVDGVAELPFGDMLSTIGMRRLVDVPKDADQKQEWWAGWTLKEEGELALVNEIERDSPAWKAGLVAGDTIVAVNGWKVTSKDIGERMILAKEAPFKLHVFRRDELRELALTPVLQAKGKAKIKAQEKPSDEQKAMYSAWAGTPWPADKKEEK